MENMDNEPEDTTNGEPGMGEDTAINAVWIEEVKYQPQIDNEIEIGCVTVIGFEEEEEDPLAEHYLQVHCSTQEKSLESQSGKNISAVVEGISSDIRGTSFDVTRNTIKEETLEIDSESDDEINIEDGIDGVTPKNNVGDEEDEFQSEAGRRVVHSQLHTDYKLRDSISEASCSKEYKLEEFSTKENAINEELSHGHAMPHELTIPGTVTSELFPQETGTRQSEYGQIKSEESEDKEAMSEEEHVSEDSDEWNDEDVREFITREERNSRTEWGVVKGECPSKKSTCKGDDEEEEEVCTCSGCGKTFASHCDIALHLKFTHSHKKLFKCELCGKVFKGKHELNSHSQIHSDAKPFKCQVCSESFGTMQTLVLHRFVHSGQMKYECIHCEETFERKADFDNHQPLHDGMKVWKCRECGESFGRWKEVVMHHNAKCQKKGLTCDACGEEFKRKSVMGRHMLRHALSHQCSICGEKFSHGSKLNRHVRSHTIERPYPCTVCKKSFQVKGNLVKHIWTHTGEKPYPCTTCEKRFLCKQALVEHMWTHTGEKLYNCKNCERRFTRKDHLHRHLEKEHANDMPFRCEECMLRFNKWKKLREHKKEVHLKTPRK